MVAVKDEGTPTQEFAAGRSDSDRCEHSTDYSEHDGNHERVATVLMGIEAR